jgi:hypothetical protein
MIDDLSPQTRRDLLSMIGRAGGGLAMYQAMTALGHAAETQFPARPRCRVRAQGPACWCWARGCDAGGL